jgi:hypothetical protein
MPGGSGVLRATAAQACSALSTLKSGAISNIQMQSSARPRSHCQMYPGRGHAFSPRVTTAKFVFSERSWAGAARTQYIQAVPAYVARPACLSGLKHLTVRAKSSGDQ